jgi:hypothetical protein
MTAIQHERAPAVSPNFAERLNRTDAASFTAHRLEAGSAVLSLVSQASASGWQRSLQGEGQGAQRLAAALPKSDPIRGPLLAAATALTGPTPDATQAARALRSYATLLRWNFDPHLALDVEFQARAAALAAGDLGLVASSTISRALSFITTLQFADARRELSLADEALSQARSRYREIRSVMVSAYGHTMSGSPAKALDVLSGVEGDPVLQSSATLCLHLAANQSQALAQLGECAASIALMERVRRRFPVPQNFTQRACREVMLVNLGAALIRERRIDLARRIYVNLEQSQVGFHARGCARIGLLWLAARFGTRAEFEHWRTRLEGPYLPPDCLINFLIERGNGEARFGERSKSRESLIAARSMAVSLGRHRSVAEVDGILSALSDEVFGLRFPAPYADATPSSRLDAPASDVEHTTDTMLLRAREAFAARRHHLAISSAELALEASTTKGHQRRALGALADLYRAAGRVDEERRTLRRLFSISSRDDIRSVVACRLMNRMAAAGDDRAFALWRIRAESVSRTPLQRVRFLVSVAAGHELRRDHAAARRCLSDARRLASTYRMADLARDIETRIAAGGGPRAVSFAGTSRGH